MRDVERVFLEEIKKESYIRALTDDFSVVDLVENVVIDRKENDV